VGLVLDFCRILAGLRSGRLLARGRAAARSAECFSGAPARLVCSAARYRKTGLDEDREAFLRDLAFFPELVREFLERSSSRMFRRPLRLARMPRRGTDEHWKQLSRSVGEALSA